MNLYSEFYLPICFFLSCSALGEFLSFFFFILTEYTLASSKHTGEPVEATSKLLKTHKG